MKKVPLKRLTPLKKKSNSTLKKGSKIKVRPKTEEQKEEKRLQREKDYEFYMSIWNERPHYCEACGVWLGNEMKPLFMDHLLEKNENAYPHLRYEKENIFVVCGEHHGSKTNGFPHPKHQEAINKARESFL